MTGAEATNGRYLTFDSMCWPNPDDRGEVAWRLRYGEPTKADLMWAASVIGAYRQLVDDPRRVRDSKVSRIRRDRDEWRRRGPSTAVRPGCAEPSCPNFQRQGFADVDCPAEHGG